ncbi:hypothetical protein A2Y99_00825 [Candidatus Gottesmanbacteria bacterium RBG_13_37_7]|uniref:Uncharacterized protein n=1 Tax=Candidatus Gottesmanbacteria bacterium RBG_13_37_7 TaxID=1798369 RepID=A0A1F5YKI4_9BACT|nr:MAG: hypothetical protein A2Y99_00825 [Candidatus Gottesmanbacteria bacterium RBG_13_37_7]
MTSNRLALIFLGFIFLIIVILTSSKIAGFLRTRFARFLPSNLKLTKQITPTPTPTVKLILQPTIIPTVSLQSASSVGTRNKSSSNGEIPATGPAEISYLVLGGSMLGGFILKKFRN